MAIRVLIADDHRLFREGLAKTLADQGMVIAGEAGDGEQAVFMVKEVKPDVILMDVSMPNCDGVDAVKMIREQNILTPIIMLTMHTDKEVRLDASYVGANKYLVKDCSVREIIDAIIELALKEPGLTPTKQTKNLSAREIDVLQLAANGFNINKIGKALNISEKTVKNHLSSAYAKLKVQDRTQAVVKAIQLGLVEIPPAEN